SLNLSLRPNKPECKLDGPKRNPTWPFPWPLRDMTFKSDVGAERLFDHDLRRERPYPFLVLLLAFDYGTQAPNLSSNLLQEGEDGAYQGGHGQGGQENLNGKSTPALEGPMSRGRLKRIQEEVQHKLAHLKANNRPKKGGGHPNNIGSNLGQISQGHNQAMPNLVEQKSN
ncbi:hypothetical protein CR513_03376, partial [Mucuna pruriens]